ncbi:hypothetical protein [Thermomonospora cellulosilytica]|uniref:Uncharacterized protein n=1 Tax=Thermomonospora cellulosilytica TaxID=1411118 RepID=A0A7W3N1Y1_9ACTN|nr:hypothetical protein [Thermomonospora cellulosilytica]MBA9005977.1 hypothetical protein [Thermomonospora cellulosilytica]
MTVSGECASCREILCQVHTMVLRALDIAGKRMVTSRLEYKDLPNPTWLRHTHRKIYRSQLDILIRPGDWDLLAAAIPGRPEIIRVADTYVRELLIAGIPHDISYLEAAFEQAGIAP